jgi:transcriptional regulator with XRE-family HTH domain
MSGLVTFTGLPVLSRMARAALNWTQDEASDAASVPSITIKRFETGTGTITVDKLTRLFTAYDMAGASLNVDGDTIGVSISRAKAAEVADAIAAVTAARRRAALDGEQSK